MDALFQPERNVQSSGIQKALGIPGENASEGYTPTPYRSRVGRRGQGQQLLIRLGELFLLVIISPQGLDFLACPPPTPPGGGFCVVGVPGAVLGYMKPQAPGKVNNGASPSFLPWFSVGPNYPA